MAASVTDKTFPTGRIPQVFTGEVKYTNSVASTYFTLKAGWVPLDLQIVNQGATVHDAGTSATISIGSTGNNGAFVAAYDVKANVNDQTRPSSTLLLGAPLAFDTDVTAIVNQAGSAGSEGGPWTFYMTVLTL